MIIVIITETFSKNMGYMTSMLPRYLARHGAEVHVISADLSPYYQTTDFAQTYSEFSKRNQLRPGTVELYDGYTLHILRHERVFGYIRLSGMRNKLSQIRPDIVYSIAAIGWIALESALLKPFLGYKLFTGSHTTASVFPLASRQKKVYDYEFFKSLFTRGITGRFASLFTEKCYGATKDCADIAARFFGVQQRKIVICPLGVDTDIFHPLTTEGDIEEREAFRQRLGVHANEIVCVYTGRFSDAKNPMILGKAIARLVANGELFSAIFVGHGVQAEALKQLPGCTVFPFTPVENLPMYFRSADVGVWPTQESTSMLDAAACGLPIVVNDSIVARERIEGNGLTYHLNDVDDMVRVLLLLKDTSLRKSLGGLGAHKMKTDYNWSAIALRRLNDFRVSLGLD